MIEDFTPEQPNSFSWDEYGTICRWFIGNEGLDVFINGDQETKYAQLVQLHWLRVHLSDYDIDEETYSDCDLELTRAILIDRVRGNHLDGEHLIRYHNELYNRP